MLEHGGGHDLFEASGLRATRYHGPGHEHSIDLAVVDFTDPGNR